MKNNIFMKIRANLGNNMLKFARRKMYKNDKNTWEMQNSIDKIGKMVDYIYRNYVLNLQKI